ncbi:hypothetical protein D1Y84_08435 [Acidipila sp. EB88]|nr:hypothetical protein D1Y84_08435 [Acidipila sp. EB88]
MSLTLTAQKTAHAYADPGTSLMLVQSLSAAASGLLFYFRRRLKLLFTRRSSTTAATDQGSPTN